MTCRRPARDRSGARRRSGPKYKNSQDGPIYSKRRTLYGLNWAKADVVANGEVIVCEGYTDVIAFFQAGLPRAVATCGTALGEEHFRVLGNFARRVVLAYDADAAGQAGAGRVYEWERHHAVDVAVAAPAGRVPIPPTWPATIPTRCAAPSPRPSRFSPSGSTGSCSRPTCAPPKGGPRRPRPPWPWWPSTPTSSCATST